MCQDFNPFVTFYPAAAIITRLYPPAEYNEFPKVGVDTAGFEAILSYIKSTKYAHCQCYSIPDKKKK